MCSRNCNFKSKFKISDEIIEIVPSDELYRQTTIDGTTVHSVPLGSSKHTEFLSKYLLYLENKCRMRNKNQDIQQIKDQLDFIQQYCNNDNTGVDDSDSESDPFSTTDALEIESGTTQGEVIHITSETFGAILNVKNIQLPKQKSFLSPPILRQYFVGDMLHRQEHKMHVAWIELFYDLIYVGAFAKTVHFIQKGYDWNSFLKFILLFVPFLYRWRGQTLLKNTVHHETATSKFFGFLNISCVVLMITTSYHAFDLSPDTNTGAFFLICHILSGFLIEVYVLVAAYSTSREFLVGTLYRTGFWLLFIAPYFVVLSLPTDGTVSRDKLKKLIWGIGILSEILIHPASVFVFQWIPQKHRIAVNIEHFAERHGLLIVIVLGEIVVNGIDDFVANYSVQTVVDTLLVLSISFGLFYLYFRAEIGSHLKHALRRHKLSAILWSIIHLPISISFVSIASCLSGMLEISTKAYLGKGSQTVTYEHQSITAASFAASFYCLSALGLLHLDRPVTPSKRKLAFVPTISKLNRTVFRLFLGTLILVLGLTINIQASTWIYFTSLLCLFAVCVEEYGRTKYHQY